MNSFIKQIRQLQVILNKNPLYSKYSIFIIPALILIIGLLIVVFITIPQTIKLLANNQVSEQYKQKEAAYQAKITVLNQIDAVEYKSDLNKTLTILPVEKDIPSAINSVLQVISSAGLTLTNFSIGPNGTPIAGVDNFSISIDLTGSTDQVKNLITITDRASRLMKITSLNINNGNGNTTQANIKMAVFFAPLDTAIKTDSDQSISLLTPEEKNLLQEIGQNIQTNAPVSEEVIQDGPTGKDDPFN